MSLSQHLHEYIATAFTGMWVRSFEHEEALAEIAGLCREHGWGLAVWDVDRGLRVGDASAEAPEAQGPVAAIRAAGALARPGGTAVLVLPNFHRFLHGAEVVQALAHAIAEGKAARTFVIVLAPVVESPMC